MTALGTCERPYAAPDAAPLGDHLDRLYRAAYGFTGTPHDAEDLVQETYARVLSRPRRMIPGRELGYLLTALRHTFIDMRRRRRLEVGGVDEMIAAMPDERPEARPDHGLAASEVYAAVAALPEPYREVVAAVDLAGLAYREAAELLGVPIGTVMSRLYRGRAQVVAALGDGACGD